MEIEQVYPDLTYADLQRYVAEGQEEHLHLEFKSVKSASLRSEDDKRNLAIALSGFANSSGGIVVWGVDARKGMDNIDRAQSLAVINPVAEFVSRLNELTGSFVEPLVDGVQHRAIIAAESAGFALTMVPESGAGPHMAKAGQDRYFKRSGDSFYRMEHFDIADMFGRRRRPELRLAALMRSAGAISGGGRGTRHIARIVLSIMNIGRGSAVAPYLSLRIQEPHKIDRYGIDGNGSEGLPRLATAGDSRFYAYGSNSLHVIHSDTQQDVCAIKVEVARGGSAPPDVVIAYSLSAEGIRKTDSVLTIPGSDIAKAVLP